MEETQRTSVLPYNNDLKKNDGRYSNDSFTSQFNQYVKSFALFLLPFVVSLVLAHQCGEGFIMHLKEGLLVHLTQFLGSTTCRFFHHLFLYCLRVSLLKGKSYRCKTGFEPANLRLEGEVLPPTDSSS